MGPEFSRLGLANKIEAIVLALEARAPGIVDYFEEQAALINAGQSQQEPPAPAPQPVAPAPTSGSVDDSQVPHEQTVSVQPAPESDGPQGADAVSLSAEDAKAFAAWKQSQQAYVDTAPAPDQSKDPGPMPF